MSYGFDAGRPQSSQYLPTGLTETNDKQPTDGATPAKQARLGKHDVKLDHSDNKENSVNSLKRKAPGATSSLRNQLSLKGILSRDARETAATGVAKKSANTLPLPVATDQLQPVKTLGRGTFGAVQLLESQGASSEGKKQFAFKTTTATSESGKEQLAREAQLMSEIPPHDNILKSYGMQTINGQEGLVLEFVNGKELGSVLETAAEPEGDKTDYPVTVSGRHVELWHQVLSGVAHLHEQDIIHGDLKPTTLCLMVRT